MTVQNLDTTITAGRETAGSQLPAIVLPTMSWAVIRLGETPGALYVKTMLGKWLNIQTGRGIRDAELTALANEIVYGWPRGSKDFQAHRVGFVELIDSDRVLAATVADRR
jgi:hypothetical protein